MRISITGKDGADHVVDFDSQPTDADIDEVANSFASAAPRGKGNMGGYTGQFAGMADATADQYGISRGLLRAVVHHESGWNPRAVSPVGAVGLGQLMPATARGLGVSDPYDPAQNLQGAAKYMRQMLDKYKGDTAKALAAYNAGAGNVDKYGGVPPFAETQKYVKNIMGAFGNGDPYGDPASQPGYVAPPPLPKLKTKTQLAAEAKLRATQRQIYDQFVDPKINNGLPPDKTIGLGAGLDDIANAVDPVKRPSILFTPEQMASKRRAAQPLTDADFAKLNFTLRDFQAANDQGTAVRTRNGKTIELADAYQRIIAATGKNPGAYTKSQSDVEQDVVQRGYDGDGKAGVGQTVGFNKGQKDSQVPRGMDQRQVYERNHYNPDGTPITRSQRLRDAVNGYQKSIEDYMSQSFGTPRAASGMIGGLLTSPINFGAEVQTVGDTQEDTDTRLKAGLNVAIQAATSLVGGEVVKGVAKGALKPVLGPVAEAIKPFTKFLEEGFAPLREAGGIIGDGVSQAFGSAIKTGDIESAVRVATERMGMPEHIARQRVQTLIDSVKGAQYHVAEGFVRDLDEHSWAEIADQLPKGIRGEIEGHFERGEVKEARESLAEHLSGSTGRGGDFDRAMSTTRDLDEHEWQGMKSYLDPEVGAKVDDLLANGRIREARETVAAHLHGELPERRFVESVDVPTAEAQAPRAAQDVEYPATSPVTKDATNAILGEQGFSPVSSVKNVRGHASFDAFVNTMEKPVKVDGPTAEALYNKIAEAGETMRTARTQLDNPRYSGVGKSLDDPAKSMREAFGEAQAATAKLFGLKKPQEINEATTKALLNQGDAPDTLIRDIGEQITGHRARPEQQAAIDAASKKVTQMRTEVEKLRVDNVERIAGESLNKATPDEIAALESELTPDALKACPWYTRIAETIKNLGL